MKSLLLPAIALLMAGATGCNNNKKPPETSPTASALDVTRDPSSGPVSTYTPAPTSPVLAAPDPVASQTPVAAGASSYTVKKGDTLYAIARARYGDGKQWQRIASANPGTTPQSLKVGQTLVIP